MKQEKLEIVLSLTGHVGSNPTISANKRHQLRLVPFLRLDGADENRAAIFDVQHKSISLPKVPIQQNFALNSMYQWLQFKIFSSVSANLTSCSFVRFGLPFGCFPARRSFLFSYRRNMRASMLSAVYSRPF